MKAQFAEMHKDESRHLGTWTDQVTCDSERTIEHGFLSLFPTMRPVDTEMFSLTLLSKTNNQIMF